LAYPQQSENDHPHLIAPYLIEQRICDGVGEHQESHCHGDGEIVDAWIEVEHCPEDITRHPTDDHEQGQQRKHAE
jgi:hypothetical protein